MAILGPKSLVPTRVSICGTFSSKYWAYLTQANFKCRMHFRNVWLHMASIFIKCSHQTSFTRSNWVFGRACFLISCESCMQPEAIPLWCWTQGMYGSFSVLYNCLNPQISSNPNLRAWYYSKICQQCLRDEEAGSKRFRGLTAGTWNCLVYFFINWQAWSVPFQYSKVSSQKPTTKSS